MALLLMGFMFLASVAKADWLVPAKSFGLKQSLKADRLGIAPAVNGEDDIVLMPTGSLGFSVGSGSPNYGYTGGLDFVFAHVVPGSTPGSVAMTPFIGIGGDLFVDFGDYINSGFHLPVKADGGINIIGPQINGLVPSAQIVWNFETKEEVRTVGFTAPFDLFSGDIIKKVIGF
jgi:hypothetical protein